MHINMIKFCINCKNTGMAFLQETHLIKKWVGQIFLIDTSTSNKGVGVLINRRCHFKFYKLSRARRGDTLS